MSQFTRFFSGKFQNLWNCAGVKKLTNIMSVTSSASSANTSTWSLVSPSASTIITSNSTISSNDIQTGSSVFCFQFPISILQIFSKKNNLDSLGKWNKSHQIFWGKFLKYTDNIGNSCAWLGGPRWTVVAPAEPWRGQGLIWQASLLTYSYLKYCECILILYFTSVFYDAYKYFMISLQFVYPFNLIEFAFPFDFSLLWI